MCHRRFDDFSNLENLFTPSPIKLRENFENTSILSGYGDLTSVSSFLRSELLNSKITDLSDIDLNVTDFLNKEIEDALKARKLLDKNLVDQIIEYKCLLKEVAAARSKCKASEFVLQTMKEVFENSAELPSDLKKKCSQHMRFSNFLRNFKNSKLLAATGISDTLPPISLTCDEKQPLHSVVQKAIKETISKRKSEEHANRDLIDLLENLSKNVVMPGSTLTEENAKVLSLIKETNEAIDSCFKKTSAIMDTFDQLWDCRVQKFQILHKEEMTRLSASMKLVELEFKNLNLHIKNSMVQENDDIEKALDVLLEKLQSIFEENEFSLQKMGSMKEAYDKLKGTRFEEILNEYSELREIMKHKQWALKQIQKQT